MTGLAPYILTSVVAAAAPTAVVVPVLSNRVSKANEERDAAEAKLRNIKDPNHQEYKYNHESYVKNYYQQNKEKYKEDRNLSTAKCHVVYGEENDEYWTCYKVASES